MTSTADHVRCLPTTGLVPMRRIPRCVPYKRLRTTPVQVPFYGQSCLSVGPSPMKRRVTVGLRDARMERIGWSAIDRKRPPWLRLLAWFTCPRERYGHTDTCVDVYDPGNSPKCDRTASAIKIPRPLPLAMAKRSRYSAVPGGIGILDRGGSMGPRPSSFVLGWSDRYDPVRRWMASCARAV